MYISFSSGLRDSKQSENITFQFKHLSNRLHLKDVNAKLITSIRMQVVVNSQTKDNTGTSCSVLIMLSSHIDTTWCSWSTSTFTDFTQNIVPKNLLIIMRIFPILTVSNLIYSHLKSIIRHSRKWTNFHQNNGQWTVCQKKSFCSFLFLDSGKWLEGNCALFAQQIGRAAKILACCHQYAIMCFGTGGTAGRRENIMEIPGTSKELSWKYHGTSEELLWWKDASKNAIYGRRSLRS